ncbi:MAG: T9SS type A sorting domain-containing protein [Chitinophagales bacterium]|nr:T9SS type A sorting domain-containing protein [Chitinophagales bacterium]
MKTEWLTILFKKLISLIGFCFIINSLLAQNPDANRTNHWFFGENAGLDFSSGTAIADTNGKMTVLEGSATISDTDGNLLFYTDGKTVWNAEHDTMMNGSGLAVGLYGTPRQGALIVPKPGSNIVYYIFTVDGFEHQWQNGLQYSVVDMTLDNGRGGITQKNILLFTPSTEQLAGVKDASGCGYWIVSHERYSNRFRAYRITTEGVDTNAVVSAIGADYGYMASLQMAAGGLQLKFSPDAAFAASFNFWAFLNGTQIPDTLELYQFNSSSGLFSNKLIIPTDTNIHAYVFSPNSKMLFVESGYLADPIFCYTLTIYDQNAITNSKFFVWSPINYTQTNGDFQITPDEKIIGGNELQYSLNEIQSPNLFPQYFPQSISLAGKEALSGLPNFIQSYFYDSATICTTSISEIENDSIHLFPNLAHDWLEVSGNDFEQVQLFDITGKLIFVTTIKNISQNFRIDISNFPRGIYIISCSSKNNYFNQKIILQ